jgi:hypothetical protein
VCRSAEDTPLLLLDVLPGEDGECTEVVEDSGAAEDVTRVVYLVAGESCLGRRTEVRRLTAIVRDAVPLCVQEALEFLHFRV